MSTKKIEFRPISLNDYDLVYPYTAGYGEGSCQHSPVSMFSLSEKYGDEISVIDGMLYILRSRLCSEDTRVYLAPLGKGDMKEAFQKIMEDALSYGKKTKFITLTEKKAGLLEKEFPGRFEIIEDPNLAEYIYLTEKMASFPGGELVKRRKEVHGFWHKYGERASVTKINEKDYNDILEFESRWLEESKENHDEDALSREYRMIKKQLDNYDMLHLSGVVLRIDGVIHGFSYGTRLSEVFYDAIVEKGDRSIPHVYKVIRQESVKQCAMSCKYVNLEEDVGVEGLKRLKLAYKPEYLLKKYIVTEKD